MSVDCSEAALLANLRGRPGDVPQQEELGAEAMASGMRALASYAEVREKARVLVSAEVLQPSAHATTLRGIDGNLHIQDGRWPTPKSSSPAPS